jgi:hypothetical protein
MKINRFFTLFDSDRKRADWWLRLEGLLERLAKARDWQEIKALAVIYLVRWRKWEMRRNRDTVTITLLIQCLKLEKQVISLDQQLELAAKALDVLGAEIFWSEEADCYILQPGNIKI